MKNNNTNIAFKIIALFFTLQFHALKPIEMPWYQQFFNNGNHTTYWKNCNHINRIENIRCIALSAYYRITNRKSNLNKSLISIKTELVDIEKWMLALEQEALLAIKEKYQISNEIWQKYVADVHRMKTIYAKKLTKNNPEIVHDPNIPADILEILITLLKQNNINPYSIHLKMISDQKKINKEPGTAALTKTPIKTLDTLEDNIFTFQHKPSSIEIFPITNTHSNTDKIAICAHEIQHIIQHHALKETILTEYLECYCNIDIAEFEKTPEYIKLSQIYEAQAEILSAIKDPKIATYLKILRQQFLYPDHLYEEHFFHLAYINTLWKVHGWLEDCHQANLSLKPSIS